MLMMNQVLGFGAGGAGMSSIIQSIQQITITVLSAATSNTATISTVNTSNSVIFLQGMTTNSAVAWEGNRSPVNALLTLTNSTTVTALKNATGSDVTYYATVVEFVSGAIASIQRGSIAINGVTSNTATISTVNTSNSVCFYQGHNSAIDDLTGIASVSLTNSTTVTANRGVSTASLTTIGYCVVEFTSVVIQSIQQKLITINATLVDTTITSVNTAATILILGGFSIASAGLNSSRNQFTAVLESSTNIRIENASGSSPTANESFYVTALEFKPSFVNSLQRGLTTDLSAVNPPTVDDTITGVTTTKAVAVYTGNKVSGSAGNTTCNSLALQSSTSIRSTRNTFNGSTSKVSYEVIEFK